MAKIIPLAEVEVYGLKQTVIVEDQRDICLCFQGCLRFVDQPAAEKMLPVLVAFDEDDVSQIKKAFNCPTAQANYENCVASGIAAPVTRCAGYITV